MGQSDVLDILKAEYKLDHNRYFTAKDIREKMLEKGFSNGVVKNSNDDLMKLVCFKVIKSGIAGGFVNPTKVFKLK